MTTKYFRRGRIIWRFITDDSGDTRGDVRLADSVAGWTPSVMMINEMTPATDVREIPATEGEP
jgi:hypothetical protein